MTRPAESKLISGRQLLRLAWRDYRHHWWGLALIAVVVALPVNLLNLLSTPSQSGLTGYTTAATIFMNVAIFYAATRLVNGQERPSIGEAYYQGTARSVVFILVSGVVVLMLVPATLGLLFYLIGTLPTAGSSISLGEQILIGFIALLLAVPTVWWLVRFFLAPFGALAESLPPLATLRRARQLTLGRFWQVLGRLVIIGLAAIVIAFILVIFPTLIDIVWHSQTALSFIFQLLLSLILLPLAGLYLARLYLELSEAEE